MFFKKIPLRNKIVSRYVFTIYPILIFTFAFSQATLAQENPINPPTDGKISTIPSEWEIVSDGGGYVSFNSESGITMQPSISTSPLETHACLTLSKSTKAHPMTDFQIVIRASTEEQLRMPTPNGWEVFSIYFNYNLDSSNRKETNYLKLTYDGLEIGTLSDKTGQTFLATSNEERLIAGKINTYSLTKKGNQIDISIDGLPILSFKNTSKSNRLYSTPGAIGLYTEDARVHIYSVDVLPINN